MKKCVFLLLSAMLFLTATGQQKAVPSPEVIGPLKTQGTIFGASVVDLSLHGYIEEEFFIKGKANTYDYSLGEGIPSVKQYPYVTRIIIRRPQSPQKYNGTVVVEWLNVSSMFDVDSDWWQLHEYMMRSGYVWVGVSAQRAGIHSPTGLKNWNPARYGQLDVTADSTFFEDELCFDIFAQAVIALKGNQSVKPLSKLKPQIFIASGHSQSANYLTWYYNLFQPQKNIIDGFIIRGAGEKLRTDLKAKVFKVNAETDLIELEQIESRQPDSEQLTTWEFTGTSHADQTFMDCYSKLCQRDFGSFKGLNCEMEMCSVVPFYYGYSALLDHMNRWIRTGKRPPSGIPMSYVQLKPFVVMKLDSLGHVMGGIQLPQFAVPVTFNSGINAGESFCKYYGTHRDFDWETLLKLYPTHRKYMKLFTASVLQNLKSGYILKSDTARMMKEARSLSYKWWVK